jgi:hypothetical protein
MRNPIPVLLLCLGLAGCRSEAPPVTESSPAARPSPATLAKFSRLWAERAVTDYRLEGRHVTFGGTVAFETRVEGGRVVAALEDGAPAAVGRATTVQSLFELAARPVGENEYVEIRQFDEAYGVPEWIGVGRRDITDTGGFTEITDFVPNPKTAAPVSVTYPDALDVSAFDGVRLALRKGDEVLAYSLADRRLTPVTTGVVAGGTVRIASPHIVWSTVMRANYAIFARNLESGKTRTITDGRQDDAFDFLCDARWVAWRNSQRSGYSLNLTDLDTGVNKVVSAVSFIGMDGNVLLSQDRLFWMDDESGTIRQFRGGAATKVVAQGRPPCSLVGVDGNMLYVLAQRDGKCAEASGRFLVRYDLASGRRTEVAATMTTPSTVAVGSGLVVWIDTRDGVDDVYGMSAEDGRERRISSGSDHQTRVFVSGRTIIWDEWRYGVQKVHRYDWVTGKDELLWSCGSRK